MATNIPSGETYDGINIGGMTLETAATKINKKYLKDAGLIPGQAQFGGKYYEKTEQIKKILERKYEGSKAWEEFGNKIKEINDRGVENKKIINYVSSVTDGNIEELSKSQANIKENLENILKKI